MKILLINGKKRSGKDFFAEELKKNLVKDNKAVAIMSFAEPLKEIIADTFEITLEELDSFKNDPDNIGLTIFEHNIGTKDTDFRKVLQRFGTDAMKKYFGEDVWVDLLLSRVKSLSDVEQIDYIIVPDFRFESENIGDYTICVVNDDVVSDDTHTSENSLDDFDFDVFIDNTGYQDLTDQVNVVKSLIYNLDM